MRRIKFKNYFKNGILVLLPWRDALGINSPAMPFRFGEIFAFILGFKVIFLRSIKLRRYEFYILASLFINLLLTIFGFINYSNSIDQPFAIKYLIRNIIYLMMMLSVFAFKFTYDSNDIRRLMKYTIYIELISCLIIMFSGLHLYLGKLEGWDDILISGQYILIAGRKVPRFMGTASEAGYLAPLLVMPLYYFSISYIKQRKKDLKYLLVTIFLILMTFSAAVYISSALVETYVLIKNGTRKKSIILISVAIISILVVLFFGDRIPGFNNFSKDLESKVSAFFGNRSSKNWSANDRLQHLNYAWKFFSSGSILQKIFGHGTGAYYALAKKSSFLLVTDVEEAYNLYLSTLTDRGIIGLILIFMIFYNLKKILIDNISSMTIWIGIITQIAHWLITGNFWIYVFWFEIAILSGIKYEEEKNKNSCC